MKQQKIDSILKEVLDRVKPSNEELKTLYESLKEFINKVEKKIKKLKISAEVFIGGSYAKGTIIKKDHYDIDIFVRFEGYKDADISDLIKEIVKDFDATLIHGSRDYYRIKINPSLFFEVVPVKKIKNPKQAENITDLSYSHVNYVRKKVKSQKILDDVRIAKAFCYATSCYGAESYIGGFSGYAIELLVYYYKGFLPFLKAMTKTKKDLKVIIDIEKHYKNKAQVMMDINSAKLGSPIILIDPTYKERNALAALCKETLEKFKKQASAFLKNPSLKAFESKKTDLEKIKKEAKKKNHEFILLEASTDKQAGDIAGSKLLKFYRHLTEELLRSFQIKNKGFNYNKDKRARYFFVTKTRGEIILSGPKLSDKENLVKFKEKHPDVFTRENKIFAREKIKLNIKDFIETWRNKNREKLKEMSIIGLRVI